MSEENPYFDLLPFVFQLLPPWPLPQLLFYKKQTNTASSAKDPAWFFKGYFNNCTDHHSIMHTTKFQANAILTDASFLFFFFGAGLQMAKK